MRRVVRLVCVMAVAAALVVAAAASPSAAVITCEKTWTNPGVSGVWEDPGLSDGTEPQWTPAGVPTGTDSVCLPAGNYTVTMVAVPNIVEALRIGTNAGGAQPTLAITGLGQPITLVVTGDVETHGTLRLGHASLASDLSLTFGGAFLNAGTIDMIEGGGGTRTLDGAGTGSLTNTGTLRSSATGGRWRCATVTTTGTLDVDPGKQLDVASGGCGGLTLVVAGGSVINDGLLMVPSGLTVNGPAALTGANPVSLVGGPLSFTGSPTGKVRGGEPTIAGTIPAGIEILMDDFDPGSSAFLNLSGNVTNNGTVRLTGADLGAAFIVAGTNTFTNNGSVLFDQGADGGRGVRSDPPGSFVNQGLLRSSSDEGDYCGTVTNAAGGTIDLDPGSTFAPHGFCTTDELRLIGGTVLNEGLLRANDALTIGGNVDLRGGGASNPVFASGGTVTFQAGSTAKGAILLPFDADLTSGTIPEDITLTVRASGFVDTIVETLGPVTNEGTIRLTSEGAPFRASLSLFGANLTNNGTIELLQGTGGERLIGALGNTLVNNGMLRVSSANGRHACVTTVNGIGGTIDIDPGAAWIPSCGSSAVNVTGGTVIVDGTLQANTVTISGGRVGGSEGTIAADVTNSGGTVAPGASVGTLVIDGTYTQTAGGRLEIETQTPGPGLAPTDVLGVEGNVSLAGTVTVDAAAVVATSATFLLTNGVRTGTFTNVRGVPDAWVTYPFINAANLQSVVTFPDVPLTHPFFLDIAWAAGEDIVNGFADGTFKPGNTATRQAVVAMLYRLAGSPDGDNPPCTSAPFPDVPTSHPFCGEIDWASDEGHVNGFADGTFKPANTITRQALMAIIYRMAGSPDGDNPTCSSTPFPDVTPAHPFCGEIEWAKAEGLANGFADGTFKPANTLTRQAIAAFLHRFSDADLVA